MRARAITAVLLLAGVTACDGRVAPTASAQGEEDGMRYVSLGDSYTIGTSVEEAERWPNQLVARVPQLELVANPAVNGYTSADVIDRELPLLDGLRPEFVSLLVGVNDVVQGVPDSVYAGNVSVILDRLLQLVPPDRVLCVATPDYTRTPRGGDYGDPELQSDGIVRFNAILREACELREITFVPDVFEISRAGADDPSLVAPDGLHPSGEQYRRWVDVIAPAVEVLLGG